MEYCVRDVNLNAAIYNQLMIELNVMAKRNPKIRRGLRNEMATAKFDA